MRKFMLLLDFLNCLKPLCTRRKGKQKNMFCRTFDQLVLVKLRKVTWLTSKVTVCVQIILVLKKKIENITTCSLLRMAPEQASFHIMLQQYSLVYLLSEKPFYRNSKAIAFSTSSILLCRSFCMLDCSVGGNSYLQYTKSSKCPPMNCSHDFTSPWGIFPLNTKLSKWNTK